MKNNETSDEGRKNNANTATSIQESIGRMATPVAQNNAELAEFERTFFLNELTSLNNKIDARMAIRANLFTFTIISAGTLLSLGASTNAQIALFYPVLSLFLAAAWTDEDDHIGALSAYLHDQELRHHLDGWECHSRAAARINRRRFPMGLSLATRGIFLSTQMLAILVGFTQTTLNHSLLTTLPMLCIAALTTILTAFIIQHRRNRVWQQEILES